MKKVNNDAERPLSSLFVLGLIGFNCTTLFSELFVGDSRTLSLRRAKIC
jgi:hypothetical protein